MDFLEDLNKQMKEQQESWDRTLAAFDRANAELIVEPHPSAFAYSDTQFQIIKKHIQKYEASLDPDHEVAVWLTNFGQRVLMVVTNITYEKSVLMVFHGYVDGVESTLIQHISQLNFLLTKVPKAEGREKRKIGFGEQEK